MQIFSMGIVFMLLSSPFKNLASINTGTSVRDTHAAAPFIHIPAPAFAPFAPASSSPKSLSTLPLQKIAYLICNLLTLALGLWKCRSMGLLPMGTGDWLAFETRGQVSPFTCREFGHLCSSHSSHQRYCLYNCTFGHGLYTIPSCYHALPSNRKTSSSSCRHHINLREFAT